jgi:hypothetical protein
MVGAASAAPPTVTSSFDSDAEGWTVRDLLPPFGGGQAVQWLAGGQIASTDLNSWNVFSAPLAYLGDKSAYLGGSLSFDLSDTVADADASTAYPTLALRSGLVALVWFGGAPGTALTSFAATLAPSAAWQRVVGGNQDNLTLIPATAADFAAVLGSLQAVQINADWYDGGAPVNDFSVLDNVRLAAPVPEPTTACMLGLGLLAVALGKLVRRV